MKIEGYSFGKILIDGRSYSADLILYPDSIQERWWRKQGHYLQVEDLAGLEKVACDVLVVGTGASGMMKVAGEVAPWLRGRGVALQEHPTREACDRYNSLVIQGKQVVAALHLTC